MTWLTWVFAVAGLTNSRCGDLGVRAPPPDERQHPALAPGERVQLRRRRSIGVRPRRQVLDEPAGDARRQERVAAGHDADGVEDLLGRGVLQQEAAGAGLDCGVHVLVEVERGEDHTRTPRGRRRQ